jgi:amidase
MDLSVLGPLARSARDLTLALEVLGAPSEETAKAWTWRLPRPRHRRIKDFRIGYLIDDPVAPIASDVLRQYERTIAALAKTGAKITPGWPARVDLPPARSRRENPPEHSECPSPHGQTTGGELHPHQIQY